MNRIQLACLALTASAFVLAGLLLATLPNRLDQQANAALVVSRDSITAMTARTQPDQDSVFIIENNSQKLLIYTVDLGRRRIEPAQSIDLNTLFNTGGGAPAPSGRQPR